MKNLVPESAPENGESWNQIFDDVEKIIMPGIMVLSFWSE